MSLILTRISAPLLCFYKCKLLSYDSLFYNSVCIYHFPHQMESYSKAGDCVLFVFVSLEPS